MVASVHYSYNYASYVATNIAVVLSVIEKLVIAYSHIIIQFSEYSTGW